eukprot:2434139-Alexandrium_andersonii.AAC.1
MVAIRAWRGRPRGSARCQRAWRGPPCRVLGVLAATWGWHSPRVPVQGRGWWRWLCWVVGAWVWSWVQVWRGGGSPG